MGHNVKNDRPLTLNPVKPAEEEEAEWVTNQLELQLPNIHSKWLQTDNLALSYSTNRFYLRLREEEEAMDGGYH